ncbi:extracellular matrix A-like [Paramuricea clavata]|uniref:Extracellular matrix A-like n=1 Tax=Paramuricea clavata TaxID=317549 RepID=A0A7D9H926_PARCT|nr:extracellular matrix A-like [Paramuricea clavata]
MRLKAVNIVLVYILVLSYLQDKVSGCGGGGGGGGGCSATNCEWSSWSSWSTCNHRCGSTGEQTQTRSKTVQEDCGGSCSGSSANSRSCNRNACQNGGNPIPGRCSCLSGWTGTCCESDVDECSSSSPCQHICNNVPGSYTCQCDSCYTKLGDNCELRQCKIGGRCFEYGDVNPSNQCQDCQKYHETVWTNNNALSCSDSNLCTRNDKCVAGTCKGTPFTCLECENCDGYKCTINSGFCVIDGKCYRHGDLRVGKSCQAKTPPPGVGRSRRCALNLLLISTAASGMFEFSQDSVIMIKEGLLTAAIPESSVILFVT